jgi:DNA-binding XRE family transcriptional regulator
MSSEESVLPPSPRKIPHTEIDIGGKPFVLVEKARFVLLCQEAEAPRDDAYKYGKVSIGPDLRARRTRAHLTLSEVARRAGIRFETLSRIENGRTDPLVGTVQAILHALEGAP